ncbi:hypothetical protein BGW39_009483 [Mortierella sp. 14UC]|nr:hypothetical protein BGW39_009483 [Mortierella sp. 14UC]
MVYNMAYTTVDESTLYIQGGFDGSNSNYSTRYDQFFSLDLTQDWDASNPPWSQVSVNGRMPEQLSTAGHTMSFSRAGNTLTVWDLVYPLTYAASYHLDARTWKELPSLPPPEPGPLRFYQAATDPLTDKVFIPGSAGTSMLGYDFSNKIVSVLPMPIGGNATSWNRYSFVWSEMRASFLLFGGLGSPSADSYFYEYKPLTDVGIDPWTSVSSYGSIPPHVSESCMISAYNGAKMLLFGGGVDGAEIGTLFILDVATMTWSRGPSSQPRKGMACAVSGDNFVVWGGISWNNSGAFVQLPELPIIYNMKTTQWTTQFVGKRSQSTPAKKSSKAAIIGGVIAGIVAAVILVILLLICRKQRHHRQQERIERDFSIVAPAADQKIEVKAMDKINSRNMESSATTVVDSELLKSTSPSQSPSQQHLPPAPVSPQPKTELASTTDTEGHIHRLQKQIAAHQSELLSFRNNPQLYLPDAEDSLYTQDQRVQGPQGNGVSSLSENEQVDAICRQIKSLNAEVDRLQARLVS